MWCYIVTILMYLIYMVCLEIIQLPKYPVLRQVCRKGYFFIFKVTFNYVFCKKAHSLLLNSLIWCSSDSFTSVQHKSRFPYYHI